VEAIDLRDRLVDALRRKGVVTTKPVEVALRAVPRHAFVPDVALDVAYSDDIVRTKYDAGGATISAASQPTIVAMMLEQAVRAGDRVLEIGAGYNAALRAHLTGGRGSVTTIDVDADIVDGARTHLGAAGYPEVHVVLGDGALGYPAGGPYDRVVATVGARYVPLAWQDQVASRGRLVVPMRFRGSASRSIVFERHDDHWRATDSRMCSFMPLRGGIADDPQHLLALTPTGRSPGTPTGPGPHRRTRPDAGTDIAAGPAVDRRVVGAAE
jgi:protein-L-isoaspartate(D-aspartate) O-methyltransferase